MEARNSEPGLDIPQTRQRLEPVLTSAPHPLQAKATSLSESPVVTAKTLRHCDYFASKAEGADFREAFGIYRCSRMRVPVRCRGLRQQRYLVDAFAFGSLTGRSEVSMISRAPVAWKPKVHQAL